MSVGSDAESLWNVHIHNEGSSFLQRHEYSLPFCFTVEDCRASSNEFTIYQFSPGLALKNTFPLSTFPSYQHRPLHQHNCFELMVLFSGTMHHRVEDHTFAYHPGQCCLMNRNVRHVEDFSSDFQAAFLLLMPEFAVEICDRDIYYNPDGSSQRRETTTYQMICRNRDHQESYEKIYLDFLPLISQEESVQLFAPLFKQMLDETVQQKPGCLCMMQSLFSRLFAILEDSNVFRLSEIRADAGVQEYLFTKLTLLLEANHGRVTRSELENQLNYNGDYLNRIVKKYTSLNLTEYGQTFYLEDARRMLLETDMTISEIITKLGFSNRSHFYRIFTEKYGLTPKEYRKAKGNAGFSK